VPIYFCLFAVGGVVGSGLAFAELNFPYVLLLFPGVGFCIIGVFAISHKRDERIAARFGGIVEDGADGGGDGAQGDQHRHSRMSTSGRNDSTFGGDGMSVSIRGMSAIEGRGASGLHDSWRGVSAVSEACSVCSVASAASAAAIEETAFLALGGMSMGASLSAYRMGRVAQTASTDSLSASLLTHNTSGHSASAGGDAQRMRYATVPTSWPEEFSGRSSGLPRCSEGSDSYVDSPYTQRNTGDDGASGA
jgi:hypothetical protein